MVADAVVAAAAASVAADTPTGVHVAERREVEVAILIVVSPIVEIIARHCVKRNSNTDNKPSPKKPRLEPTEFFEEFLNVLKGRSGDREFLSSLNNVVPEFDPLSKEQTIDSWLDKIEECSEIYGWNEKQKIHYALPKLTGHARTWYQGLPSIKHTWNEWKVLLRDSFPSTENYADLLMEMLNRRARPGESLEIYYFAKINLLNRCKIFDRQAVDCLIHGIDDRGVRVGAQAAKFEKPEEVHEFFKTIKPFSREQMDSKGRNSRDTRLPNSTNNSSDTTLNRNSRKPNTITCFNCREVGHPSFKCPKPIIKCSRCNLMGHTSTNCTNKIKDQQLSEKDKSVLKVSLQNESSDKYKLVIKVNGNPIDCLVDLGSEATVIRESDAKKIGLQWKNVDGPFLRGLGNIPYLPKGSSRVDIEVQGVLEKNIEVFIVDDALISYSVLLGHSFTERPHVQIIKTTTDLKFQRVYKEPPIKLPTLSIYTQSVKFPDNLSGNVYVHGSMTHGKGNNTWDELLPNVQLGINSTVHETTKKTPTELLFGRKVGNPAQGLLNDIVDDIDIDGGTNTKTLDSIRSEASELMRKNQQIMKSRFDRRRKDSRKYKEGDLVRIARAIVTAPGQSKKLEAKCQGPYRIKKILPNDRYLVEDTPLTRKGQRYENVVAVDKIFPWLSFDEAACHSHESSDCSDNERSE
ncbi:hypothetical protein B5X24_HaOG202325 [Helicoverpa armigera]|uniref:CCHC-type domain-containing protein n=1 Tax=Helicoverpa armigera TaxID=29058 RepID=A0A2W1C2A3_HELAM|nr:hypothetical protein B5X24_HaOG202325 [Helicoverpa armigera]